LGAVAVVLALIGLDVALVAGTQQPPPRPVVQVVKTGPDGKVNDAFSVTNFVVHAGHAVKLVINNTDNGPHSITAPEAGVSITVRPGVHTYTLLVHQCGSFEWYCMYPCDPYSMAHVGYMRGYITSI
jgi:plastocyanin